MFRYLLTVFFVVLLGVVSGCEGGFVDPKGFVAFEQRGLIIFSTVLMLLVVIPVCFMAVFFAIKYRESSKNANTNYDPSWIDSAKVEIVCWGAPTIIILILSIITWRTSHSLDPATPLKIIESEPIIIQVVALDWKWAFIYPDYDIATVNYIKFPVNRPLNFKISADAPMNAFWIPQLGGMIYAMAGMQTSLHLIASEEGEYQGLSSNYSGFGFSHMKFNAVATTEEDFIDWVREVRTSSVVLDMDEYNGLIDPTTDHPVVYYSAVEADLFKKILHKYMLVSYDEMLHLQHSKNQISRR